ncbi:Disks large-associated protein 2 [Triplophysa tibetana]|uniref:Disks large-associated protein 2 n=1 Tax=Triplophysa tibetana TaxID=1572043 RepID=A0A5A9MXA3_9TELE|nr:Disks large-associated protein 2 [Triplophysa tibetana]
MSGDYPGIEKEKRFHVAGCVAVVTSSHGDEDIKTVRSDALVLKSAIQRPHIDTQSSGYHMQTARDMRPHPSVSLNPTTNPPQFRSRNQSYMRAVSTFSQASCLSQVSETEVNGQFESVCESVFSEVESQAVEALDLPGFFRTRSHSYLRAIQAGYSQDDDCLPSMTSSTVTSTLRSTTGYKKDYIILHNRNEIKNQFGQFIQIELEVYLKLIIEVHVNTASDAEDPDHTNSLTELYLEGYDAMESTSLLNEDMIDDDDGASSSAYQEIERFERENAARSQHSTSSTVTAISVPPTSSHGYRVPCPPPSQPPPDPPIPQAIQAFKESANMVAAFNMQWKEEISAMRYELAELRRDVCGELKTFNSNFFNFTQCYNMWTMCREAATGTSSTQSNERVSVGVQTAANGLVRQNTADASVMCQPEPAAFNIFDLMEPPRIEITEGTPEGTTATNSPTSPASPDRPSGPPLSKPLRRSKFDMGRKKKNCSRADGQRRIQFRLPTACGVDRTEPPTPAAVTYTPGYKKTPPPVPPRSTTKPLISVTAQSSTESTQDAYHEGRLPRGGLWAPDSLGRVRYSSVDSLDSTKAITLAMDTKRLTSAGSYSSVQTCDKAVLVSKAEEYLKTPRSSIGIQVEAATDSETDSKGLPQYHSVGIQVEDEKRLGRFKRSNSVTTAVQADLELEGFPSTEDKSLQFGGFQRHSEPSTPTQYNVVRTVRTQGLFSYREDYRPSSGPSSPQPEPWLVEPSHEAAEAGRVSPLRRDGSWFMQLLHSETKRLEGWCKDMEREAEEHDLSEEILGKIRSAVGSAHLLMSQKFQQFYWLCQQNLDPSAMPRPTAQDLAGFWDLLQLSIDDVTAKFDELQQIKSNDWRIVESPEKKERKWPPPVSKRPPKGRGIMRERSLDLQDRQRQEARRRLMAAKRAASFRQDSATERADSIEIYIPEAQTRL